jgi:hypothetical protein
MKKWILFLGMLPLLQGTTDTVFAQTSYPMLMSLKPAAAQQGTTSEHELESRYSMFGANQLLVSGTGVTGKITTPMELGKDGKAPSLTKIKLEFTIAADALPGIRDFRIIGPTGPSTVGQLVVTRNPVLYEQTNNNTPQTAQPCTFPATLCGVIERNEDIDFFKFTIAEPITLNFRCLGMQLEDKVHDLQTHIDPIIAIKNAATGSTVTMANNEFAADPFLSYEFTYPGEYLLEVRDVRYSGNKYWEYAIEVSQRPFATQVFPLGISASGAVKDLQPIGPGFADDARTTTTVNIAPNQIGPRFVTLPIGDETTNPVPVVVTDLPLIRESGEPNDAPGTAQAVTIPCGINGRIEKPGDIDCYRFDAKKGDRLSLEVLARREQSDLDSILRILRADNASQGENDDLREWNKLISQDSRIENWAAPADGAYVAEIRDVHLRGGNSFVYLLELQRSKPDFELSLDSDKSWIAPGTCTVLFVRGVKKNGFDSDIALHVSGLPEGVIAHCGRIPAGKSNDGCIILEAKPDAKQVAANIVVTGTASAEFDGQPLKLQTVAQSMQETYMPGGGRSHWPVDMHTVAVGAPGDIRAVKLSTYEVSLKPGGSQTIDVEIVRADGFNTNVTLDMLVRHLSSVHADTLPAGVTIDKKESKTLLTGQQSKGAIVLKAAKDAPPAEKQQCSLMANVSINFVMKEAYSSLPVTVSVLPADSAGKK